MAADVHVPPSFANQTMWEEILDSWLDLVKRYENRADQEEQDFCYWYNERPLTGVLSAAAWVAGGWGLEEFSAKRRTKGEKKKGRPDLWFGIGADEAAVEAKIWWVAGQFAAAERNVKKMLDEAKIQLETLKHFECQQVSICFVVACRKEPPEKKGGIAVLEKLKEWAKLQRMATAAHISEKVNYTRPNKRNYPGVLLVARQEDF